MMQVRNNDWKDLFLIAVIMINIISIDPEMIKLYLHAIPQAINGIDIKNVFFSGLLILFINNANPKNITAEGNRKGFCEVTSDIFKGIQNTNNPNSNICLFLESNNNDINITHNPEYWIV